MRRAKPCQHRRRLKSGKTITVNRGVRKRVQSKNYGYMPTVPKKKKIPLEEKPIHSLTDREFMILVEQGNFGSSPFTSTMKSRRRSNPKRSYGFKPEGFQPWDKGDSDFYKKLKKDIRQMQNRRMKLATNPPEIQDQAYSDDLRRMDKEIDRKYGVLEGMAKRRDGYSYVNDKGKTVNVLGAREIQDRERAEIEAVNRNLLLGSTSRPIQDGTKKREKARQERAQSLQDDWRELQNIKARHRK